LGLWWFDLGHLGDFYGFFENSGASKDTGGAGFDDGYVRQVFLCCAAVRFLLVLWFIYELRLMFGLYRFGFCVWFADQISDG
jgi:hypothetical protein